MKYEADKETQEMVKSCTSIYEKTVTNAVDQKEGIGLIDHKRFTEYTGGFRPHEFTILCGATGTGKTTVLANWSAQLLKQKEKHFVASFETGHYDYMVRTMSVLYGEDLNTGQKITREKMNDVTEKIGHYFADNSLAVSLYDNRMKIAKLLSTLSHAYYNLDCKIAFIDNLNFLMEVVGSNQVLVEMDNVIHDLIMFCKRVPIHIVMVMHPKKTDNGRVMSEFDIKGSSTSVQEAHNVLLFNRISDSARRKMDCNNNARELKIAKMRRRGKEVGTTLIYGCDETRYEELGALCLKN